MALHDVLRKPQRTNYKLLACSAENTRVDPQRTGAAAALAKPETHHLGLRGQARRNAVQLRTHDYLLKVAPETDET